MHMKHECFHCLHAVSYYNTDYLKCKTKLDNNKQIILDISARFTSHEQLGNCFSIC